MRLDKYLKEMAMPRSEDFNKIYYHGTSTDKAADSILKIGIKPPDLTVKKKGMLTPVEGKVYITPHLSYAVIYATGANMMGSDTVLDSWKKKGTDKAYIFVIDGKQLKDIQPDEDSVGEMIYNKNPEWLYNFAKNNLGDATLRRIMNGEYAWWAKGGKSLLKKMSDEQKLKLIDAGAHIAHGGNLIPKEAWVMSKLDNKLLKKNGSNFFKLAKRIK